MPDVAVLLVVFNRPKLTKKILEALAGAKPKRLYIAADAPRVGNTMDEALCAEVKRIVSNISWDCEVKTLFQEKNLGCSLGPRAAFKWFFSQEEGGIILEDDCVPHLDFFPFAAEMLDKYRNNKKIISINGSNLGYELKNGNSYTFSRFMNMWGWATWRDRADKINYKLTDWKKQGAPLFTIYRRCRQGIFDFDIHWFRYWQEKFDRTVMEKKVTWWDWQWIYHQLKHRQYSIVPANNLVSNIGFADDATHTKAFNNPAACIPVQPLAFPLQHPKKIKPDFAYEEKCVKWTWCYHKRLPRSFYFKYYLSSVFRPSRNEQHSFS